MSSPCYSTLSTYLQKKGCNRSLRKLARLDEVCYGRVEQSNPDQEEEDSLKAEKTIFQRAKTCEQDAYQCIEDRISQIPGTHPLGLQNATLRDEVEALYLLLMAPPAGQRVINDGRTFVAQAPTTMPAHPDSWSLRMIKADQVIHP